MKKIITILSVLIGLCASSQQLPHYSQYLFNDYAINPAVGGSKPYFDVRSNHRYQWIGITDAPRTYTVTLHGPLRNPNMAVGGFLYTDHVGPTRRTGLQLSYTYHLLLDDEKDMKLAFALSMGMLQFAVDGSKITLRDPGDAVLTSQYQRTMVFDAKFGVLWYSPKFFLGITLPQILQNKIYFFDNQTNTESNLEDHYYLAGGYKFDLNEEWQIEPSILVKYVDPAPIQFDVMARVIFRDQVWLGGSLNFHPFSPMDSKMDAATAMIGYTFRENIMIGYGYDFTLSNLQNYSTGSHELMIGIKFMTKHVAAKTGDGQRMVE